MPKINICHDYDMAFSKNQWHSVSGAGKLFNNDATQRLMDGIAMLVRGERNKQGCTFIKGVKTWVRIKVYRPDMRGDPINFMDVICDGVKVGLGIDDNVYAVEVDWELEPGNPGITVEVEQERRGK